MKRGAERIMSLLKSIELTEAEAERIIIICKARVLIPKLKAPITDAQFIAEVGQASSPELRDRIVWALAQWIIEETVSGDRDRFDGLRGAELVLSALGEKKPTDA